MRFALALAGGIGGTAIGAAIGAARQSARLATALSVTLGAIGVAMGARWAEEKAASPWWHDEAKVRTFEDVANEDAAFRAAAQAEGCCALTEAAALRDLFDGGRKTTLLTNACSSLNTSHRLEKAQARWQTWKGVTPETLGAVIKSVVDELEAPHLQPSGIGKRLESGVPAASFGLLSLMDHAAFDAK